jgi:hypothetical protein
MRRGMGLADIFLFLFVLILVVVALVITGVPGLLQAVSIGIKTDGAHTVLQSIAVERSASEALSWVSSGVEVPEGDVGFTGLESIAVHASYVYTDRLGGRTDRFIRSEHDAIFRMLSYPSRHDVYLEDVPDRQDVMSPPLEFVPVFGSDSFSLGFIEGSFEAQSVRTEYVWLPGYVGPYPVARSARINIVHPFEVHWIES